MPRMSRHCCFSVLTLVFDDLHQGVDLVVVLAHGVAVQHFAHDFLHFEGFEAVAAPVGFACVANGGVEFDSQGCVLVEIVVEGAPGRAVNAAWIGDLCGGLADGSSQVNLRAR